MKRLLLVLAASVATLLLVPGCETLEQAMKDPESLGPEKDNQPKFILTVHQIIKYPRAEMLEREIESYDGRKIWVCVNPFLHTRDIEEIVAVEELEKPGFYDLKLKLTKRGRFLWLQISVDYRNQKLALVVDGVFYREIIIDQISNEEDEWVILKGPFDQTTAKSIEKYSKTNYKYFLDKKGS